MNIQWWYSKYEKSELKEKQINTWAVVLCAVPYAPNTWAENKNAGTKMDPYCTFSTTQTSINISSCIQACSA